MIQYQSHTLGLYVHQQQYAINHYHDIVMFKDISLIELVHSEWQAISVFSYIDKLFITCEMLAYEFALTGQTGDIIRFSTKYLFPEKY